ncbi:hypothetical protein ABVT39_006329 [Epinephelus coioides]
MAVTNTLFVRGRREGLREEENCESRTEKTQTFTVVFLQKETDSLDLQDAVSELQSGCDFLSAHNKRYSRTITASEHFFWYLQYPGKPPEFLVYISGLNMTRPAESLMSDTKFSTKLSGENHLDLQISSAAVTDSAVYYCAVKPTVTAKPQSLLINNVSLMASFSLLFPGLIAGDKISPVQDEVSQREGQSVTLTCQYETTDNDVYLNWYRHHSDLQAPQFILWKGARDNRGGEIPDKTKYGSKTSQDSTELTIKNLTLADTALYYCALETQ